MPSDCVRVSRINAAGCVLALFFSSIVALAAHAQPAAARSASAESNWWKNAVIYEIYPRSYQDTNGDGLGDLNGITEHLDYLQALGVDAIWLTPVYPSPQVEFGDNISDYRTIDPKYGTLADFHRLVAEAGKRYIRVIMDMVMNHTSDQHRWALESRSSRANLFRDWYCWRDGKNETTTGKGEPPNNWEGLFGHSAWQWDPKTHQYYYHKFYIQQPDLNWSNSAVHQAIKNIINLWINHGAAGFRFDAITTLYEDPCLADKRVITGKDGKPLINVGDPVLDDSKTDNLPGVHTVIQEMRAHMVIFDSTVFPGTRAMIGEIYLPNSGELRKMYGAPAKPEFELPMDNQAGFINKLDAAEFRQKLTDAETKIGGNIPLLLFDNHYDTRLDRRYGNGIQNITIQRVISTVLFASRGAALFYYGEEIGMKTTPPTRKQDVKAPIGITGWPKQKRRDGERTPMQWNARANGGFTTGKPWLPVPSTASTVNVMVEERNPDSLLIWYRAFIQLKKTNAAHVAWRRRNAGYWDGGQVHV